MTKQVTLENTLSGGLGLPGGQVIPGKGTITVEPEIWESAKGHPVVAARVADGTIIVDGRGRKSKADSEDHAAEIARLHASIEAKDAEIERLTKLVPAAPAVELKAEHHGGGKFNITQGESVLSSGLSKADADAFNAMSDADKAEYVKAKAEEAAK